MSNKSVNNRGDTISEKAIDESSKSIREDFFRTNEEFIERGIETSFKNLNSNVYSTVNSTFSNFNNDYERKLEKNREIHEKAVNALTNDMKKIKEKYSKKKEHFNKQEDSISLLLDHINKNKIFSQFFSAMRTNHIKKSFKKFKSHFIVEKYFLMIKKRNIFNSWRNITNALSKGRIKLKYAKIFNEKSNELQGLYMHDINKLTEILQKLEIDIRSEICERRTLAKLYDTSMNQGVEVFIKETNALIDFNSSSKKYKY
jgi:hypothetical protein